MASVLLWRELQDVNHAVAPAFAGAAFIYLSREDKDEGPFFKKIY